eukprot:gene18239-24689_t
MIGNRQPRIEERPRYQRYCIMANQTLEVLPHSLPPLRRSTLTGLSVERSYLNRHLSSDIRDVAVSETEEIDVNVEFLSCPESKQIQNSDFCQLSPEHDNEFSSFTPSEQTRNTDFRLTSSPEQETEFWSCNPSKHNRNADFSQIDANQDTHVRHGKHSRDSHASGSPAAGFHHKRMNKSCGVRGQYSLGNLGSQSQCQLPSTNTSVICQAFGQQAMQANKSKDSGCQLPSARTSAESVGFQCRLDSQASGQRMMQATNSTGSQDRLDSQSCGHQIMQATEGTCSSMESTGWVGPALMPGGGGEPKAGAEEGCGSGGEETSQLSCQSISQVGVLSLIQQWNCQSEQQQGTDASPRTRASLTMLSNQFGAHSSAPQHTTDLPGPAEGFKTTGDIALLSSNVLLGSFDSECGHLGDACLQLMTLLNVSGTLEEKDELGIDIEDLSAFLMTLLDVSGTLEEKDELGIDIEDLSAFDGGGVTLFVVSRTEEENDELGIDIDIEDLSAFGLCGEPKAGAQEGCGSGGEETSQLSCDGEEIVDDNVEMCDTGHGDLSAFVISPCKQLDTFVDSTFFDQETEGSNSS